MSVDSVTTSLFHYPVIDMDGNVIGYEQKRVGFHKQQLDAEHTRLKDRADYLQPSRYRVDPSKIIDVEV
jgi:hypothetical protein